MHWLHGTEYLAAREPDEFADSCSTLYRDEALWTRLRTNALARIREELSPETFAASVKSVIDEIVSSELASRQRWTEEPESPK
jgi:glycosyltransferase involved in cell wall biosynthesis